MGLRFPDPISKIEKFLHFSGDLLREMKCEWDFFPTRDFVRSIRHRHEHTIKQMIEESMIEAKNAGAESWGWKDPRTIATIDLYLPYLTEPKFICCYRNPTEVAESLHRRDGFPVTITVGSASKLTVNLVGS